MTMLVKTINCMMTAQSTATSMYICQYDRFSIPAAKLQTMQSYKITHKLHLLDGLKDGGEEEDVPVAINKTHVLAEISVLLLPQ
ncbi:hypothetical protein C0J52_17823 [Blattella germanica]|nr:hypothetical protein C0J52_17823 [Blattella germanica]